MPRPPRDGSPDSTLALFFEGYNFGLKRFGRYQSDIFETRLVLRKTVCMMGEEAAQVFYDEGRFRRRGALPRRGLKSFLGAGLLPAVSASEGKSWADPIRSRLPVARGRLGNEEGAGAGGPGAFFF